MKEFFKDIFTYHHHFNQKLMDQINDNWQQIPDDVFALYCHVLNAHQVWNSRILGLEPFGVQQLHHREDCKAIDYNNYQNTILIIDTVDPEKNILYKNTKGQEFSNKVRDILFHINNHSTHHRAQLATRFRSLGITPLVSDFIFYKRDQK